jgi:HK97 family phage prohead protease
VRAITRRYDPTQPRGADGRWGDGTPALDFFDMAGFDNIVEVEGTFGDLSMGTDDVGDVRLAFRDRGSVVELDLGADELAGMADALDDLADARADLPDDADTHDVYDDRDFGFDGSHRAELYGSGVIIVTFGYDDDSAQQLVLDPPDDGDDDTDPTDDVAGLLEAIDEVLGEDAVTVVERKFNPGQPRDHDGQWRDGLTTMPGVRSKIRGIDGGPLELSVQDGRLTFRIPFGEPDQADSGPAGTGVEDFDTLTLDADASAEWPEELDAADDMVTAYMVKVKAADKAFTAAEAKYGEGSPEYQAAQDAWFDVAGDGQHIAGGMLPADVGELHYEAIMGGSDEPEFRIALKPPDADEDWSIQAASGNWAGITLNMAQFRKLRREASSLTRPGAARAYSPENGTSAPSGGQFAPGGGRVGSKGKPPRRRGPRRAAAPAGPLSFDGTTGAGYGIKGGDPRVRTLQAALTRLGVTDSDGKGLAADGKYGPKTTSAVKKLQKALGVDVDGKVTPELLKQITEMKQLPATKPRARRKRLSPASRSLLLATVNRALRLGVEVRTQQLFDRAFALDDIQISRSGDGRTVEAYAACFDQPYEVRDQHGHYMEVIDRAAFNRTLSNGAGRQAMCLYNHGMSVVDGKPDSLAQVPIGTPLEIRADGRGLLTVTRYNRSPLADSVLEAVRDGSIKSQSFRGRIVRSSPDRVPLRSRSGGLPTITRHELGLTDYGPTPIPVNAGAEIMAVRSLTELVQDFAALDDDGRLQLLRHLGIDLDGVEAEETQGEASTQDDDTPTSTVELGAEDPPLTRHSGRQIEITRRIRAAQISRGMR